MRFHCPKCDTKYRITEDKLAERPTAKMRCKECSVVFSVQEAVAAEGQRASEASTPGEADAGLVVSPSSYPPPLGATSAAVAPRPSPPPAHTSSAPPSAATPLASLARTPSATRPLGSPSDRPPSATPAIGSRPTPVLAARPLGTAGAALLSPRGPIAAGSKLPGASSTGPLASSTSLTPTVAGRSRLGMTPPGGGSGNPSVRDAPFGAALGPRDPTGQAPAIPKAPATPTLAGRGLGAAKSALGSPTAPGGGAGLSPRAATAVRSPNGETFGLSGQVAELERTPGAEVTRPAVPMLGRSGAAVSPPQDSVHETATRPQNDVPVRPEALETPLATARVRPESAPQAEVKPRAADSSEPAPTSAAADLPLRVNLPIDHAPSDRGGPPDRRKGFDAALSVQAGPSATDAQVTSLAGAGVPAEPVRGLDGGLDGGVDRGLDGGVDRGLDGGLDLAVKPRAGRVVSLAVAGVVAVLFGASGLASGYLLGASKSRAPAAGIAATAFETSAVAANSERPDAPRQVSPPPPPPPDLEAEQAVAAGGLPSEKRLITKADENKTKRSAERKTDEPNAPAAPEATAAGDGARVDSLSALGSGAGPAPVAGSGFHQAAGSGAGLEAAAIQSTVQKNQNAVKRSCWQPALNNRSADAPSTARVTTTIQIAPSGNVTHVKHSGDPRGYPGLGACIVTRLKGWTFPKSNGSTTANIPFVFAAQ